MTRRAGRQSRNADFILIAAKGGDTTTFSPKGCQTLEPSGQRPVNLKNLFTFAPLSVSEHNLSTQPAAVRRT